MEIKTKFGCNDYAFMLFKDKIYEVEIDHITIMVEKEPPYYVENISITYVLKSNPAGSQYALRFSEGELFKTKEELAENLIKNS